MGGPRGRGVGETLEEGGKGAGGGWEEGTDHVVGRARTHEDPGSSSRGPQGFSVDVVPTGGAQWWSGREQARWGGGRRAVRSEAGVVPCALLPALRHLAQAGAIR